MRTLKNYLKELESSKILTHEQYEEIGRLTRNLYWLGVIVSAIGFGILGYIAGMH